MYRAIIVWVWMLIMSTNTMAHQLTPTYPVLKESIYDGLVFTELSLFNRRDDTEFYEVEVFSEDWKPISFATHYKIIQLKYLSTYKFEIYIKSADKKKVKYICTKSKLLKRDGSAALIESRICSKVK